VPVVVGALVVVVVVVGEVAVVKIIVPWAVVDDTTVLVVVGAIVTVVVSGGVVTTVVVPTVIVDVVVVAVVAMVMVVVVEAPHNLTETSNAKSLVNIIVQGEPKCSVLALTVARFSSPPLDLKSSYSPSHQRLSCPPTSDLKTLYVPEVAFLIVVRYQVCKGPPWPSSSTSFPVPQLSTF
jgi:hypothetical protein